MPAANDCLLMAESEAVGCSTVEQLLLMMRHATQLLLVFTGAGCYTGFSDGWCCPVSCQSLARSAKACVKFTPVKCSQQ
jgi:hypothetical protein